MASFVIAYGLPFVSVTLYANNRQLQLENVVIDTGSGSCAFRTDDVEAIGIFVQRTDHFHFMTGIGGQEPVLEKVVDRIEVANLATGPLRIQLSALDYRFPINGILGMDFLLHVGATINFRELTLS